MRKKSTGTLVLDALIPGKRLYLFSTGTGVAPFAGIIRDPDTYEKFEEVILTQTCRHEAELRYARDLVETIRTDELLSEVVGGKLRFFGAATREGNPRGERITTMIETGRLFSELGVPPLDPSSDRGMICGSMDMLKDTKALLEAAGLEEGANSKPRTFVVERAFVD